MIGAAVALKIPKAWLPAVADLDVLNTTRVDIFDSVRWKFDRNVPEGTVYFVDPKYVKLTYDPRVNGLHVYEPRIDARDARRFARLET